MLWTQAAEDAQLALGNIENMATLQLQAQQALQAAVQNKVRVCVCLSLASRLPLF